MQKESFNEQQLPNTVLAYFWSAIKPHKWWYFAAAGFVVGAASLSQGISYLFKIIVDAIEVNVVATAVVAGLAYPVVLFVVQLLYRGSGYAIARVQSATQAEQNDRLIAFLLRHSKSYFDNRFAGSLVSKVRSVTGGVDDLIMMSIWTVLEVVITLVVTIALIASVDFVPAMIFMVLILLIGVINYRMIDGKRALSREVSETQSELSGKQADLFTNMDAARQYARADFEKQNHSKTSARLGQLSLKNWLYTERMLAINSAILFVAFSAIMYLMLLLWQKGEITSGDFVLVLALFGQVGGLLIFLGQGMQRLARVFGEFQEGLSEVVVPLEIVDAIEARPLVVSSGAIDLDTVRFSYEKRAVLDNLSVAIPAGQRVGLVGPSGAGKSTFVSLLLRQHDIQSGAISIDGQNIAEVTQESLRKNIALVPQEPLLFHRTIKDNILYGRFGASEEDMITAAQQAHAHMFITQLEESYETLVGERGVKLSGGQKQRVAIARAMLKQAPILILDEATSALDSESEQEIQSALEELMKDKTVIAIAHRLSTLQKMDRILVFENGQIVQDGSPEELANQPGLYQRLWKHQSNGFLKEV